MEFQYPINRIHTKGWEHSEKPTLTITTQTNKIQPKLEKYFKRVHIFFFFFKIKITFDESRKLVQERTDLVLVDIPNSGKPTNHTDQQHTSQKGTLNRSVTLQLQPTLLVIFSSLITTTSSTAAFFFALGIAKEPPQALWSSTRSSSFLLLLGLFQRRAGSEEVESLVGSEAEEE